MSSDLTITIYSSSPPETTRGSKYPKQCKTQYKVSTKQSGFTVKTKDGKLSESSIEAKQPTGGCDTNMTESCSANTATRSRSGRVIRKPEKYEPVETVTDDFKPHEYDSDSGYSTED
jgi:hypothetical protein